MNIEQVPIYDIKPYENNAKKHTDAQIEEIHQKERIRGEAVSLTRKT
jgi:tRNA (Thr-GGU) A37 N-methylase